MQPACQTVDPSESATCHQWTSLLSDKAKGVLDNVLTTVENNIMEGGQVRHSYISYMKRAQVRPPLTHGGGRAGASPLTHGELTATLRSTSPLAQSMEWAIGWSVDFRSLPRAFGQLFTAGDLSGFSYWQISGKPENMKTCY